MYELEGNEGHSKIVLLFGVLVAVFVGVAAFALSTQAASADSGDRPNRATAHVHATLPARRQF